PISLFISAYFAIWCGLQEFMIYIDIYEGNPALVIGIIYDYIFLVLLSGSMSLGHYRITPIVLVSSAIYGFLSMFSTILFEGYFITSIILSCCLVYESWNGRGKHSTNIDRAMAGGEMHSDRITDVH
ncbi:MAG: hypothetical protein V3T88_04245, partial [Nitrosomonadaceae bacterium]